MVMNVADALSAYKQGGNLSGNAGVGTTEAGSGQSFSDVLKNYAGDAVKTLEGGESAAADAATGKANIASVVTAISSAELMLQTVTAIRDKVIAAYQDVTKTAI